MKQCSSIEEIKSIGKRIRKNIPLELKLCQAHTSVAAAPGFRDWDGPIRYRKPSEGEWQIDRLRTRMSSSYAALPNTSGFTPRTTAEFFAQDASCQSVQAKGSVLRCTLIKYHGLTEFGGVPTDTAVATGPATANHADAISGALGLL